MPPNYRRRHHHQNHYRCRFHFIILAYIFSGFLLLLIIFLSFYALSPINANHLRHPRFSLSYGVGAAGGKFHVPDYADDAITDKGDIWRWWSSKYFYGCCKPSNDFAKAEEITQENRYVCIATSGGLNQQRTGIIDAVVAARILNATLVVPTLDTESYWKDSSNFSQIFDVDRFISYLAEDVRIIKELPLKEGNTWIPYNMRVPRKCNESCYVDRVLPNLLKRHAVQLTKFDYRLSNRLETDLQKLRCRVNFHALKFTDPIIEMGERLAMRMRTMNKHYIALHLRFEPDMLAFSGCYYGGGEKEKNELAKLRRRWKTLHISEPDKLRSKGKCPLTPEEVGLMLRALGYSKDVHLYVASGAVYRGEETLAPLKALFPNFHSKETIASKEELEPFVRFSSRMAALDYIVCDESNVFVTNNNGNMAKILAGRRRYFGHQPTIRPNNKKLSSLFLNRESMTWDKFASEVRKHQIGFMGEPQETRLGKGEFHENPCACICEDLTAKAVAELNPRKFGMGKISMRADVSATVDDESNDNEPELLDQEEEDDMNGSQDNSQFNRTSTD
ncbi:O-fucosyltransferase 16-like [Apium graveolens]|uniref:O-fucosyltransferase 16-like n=1 Tax=Apium graveolens TaxID=4045 RepID=UPI003D79C987